MTRKKYRRKKGVNAHPYKVCVCVSQTNYPASAAIRRHTFYSLGNTGPAVVICITKL